MDGTCNCYVKYETITVDQNTHTHTPAGFELAVSLNQSIDIISWGEKLARMNDNMVFPSPIHYFYYAMAQVPPARRVRLTKGRSVPFHLRAVVKKPGEYKIYATSTYRWIGSSPVAGHHERPIEVTRFCVPDDVFATRSGKVAEDTSACMKVCVYRVVASGVMDEYRT